MKQFIPRPLLVFSGSPGLTMQKYTKYIGLLLIALGVVFFLLASFLDGSATSVTALIPAFLGVPFILIGILAELIPAKRALFMHIAVLLGVICIAGSGMGIRGLLNGEFSLSIIEQLVLCLIGIDYTINSIRSFRHARKLRNIT